MHGPDLNTWFASMAELRFHARTTLALGFIDLNVFKALGSFSRCCAKGERNLKGEEQ